MLINFLNIHKSSTSVEDFKYIVMKCFFLLLFLTIFSCKSTQEKIQVDNVFLEADKVEVWSYQNRENWHREIDVEREGMKQLEIVKGQLNIDKNFIKERIVLTVKQIKDLESVLYDDKVCEYVSIAACYQPRHLIVFYDSEEKVLNALEICLSCIRIEPINNFNYPDLCEQKMDKLEKLFKSFGINYYNENNNFQ